MVRRVLTMTWTAQIDVETGRPHLSQLFYVYAYTLRKTLKTVRIPTRSRVGRDERDRIECFSERYASVVSSASSILPRSCVLSFSTRLLNALWGKRSILTLPGMGIPPGSLNLLRSVILQIN